MRQYDFIIELYIELNPHQCVLYSRPRIMKFFFLQLTGSQESMLRVEQDDPFSDIFYFSPDSHVSAIVETTIIVVSCQAIRKSSFTLEVNHLSISTCSLVK